VRRLLSDLFKRRRSARRTVQAVNTSPLANVLTLGTTDLPRLRAFYRDLGWPQIVDDPDFAAFQLRGAVLALFAAGKLAADARGTVEPRGGGVRFTLGIVVDRPEGVDELTERVRQAGGRVTKEPVDAEFFTGRSAYVADPEDNYYEIVWAAPDNPIVAAARRAAGEDR
jgi:catechol 2,3-dioxygenase-like lactoylglutathione lyase family enzyme